MFTEQQTTAVLQALAHETRRAILDVLMARPGIGVGALAGEFDVTRIAVMNHLAVLERAGLIVSEQAGRTRRLYINVAPIQIIHDRWTTEYSAYWARRVTGIKALAEATENKKRGKHDKG